MEVIHAQTAQMRSASAIARPLQARALRISGKVVAYSFTHKER